MVNLDPEQWHFMKWLSYEDDNKQLKFTAEPAQLNPYIDTLIFYLLYTT